MRRLLRRSNQLRPKRDNLRQPKRGNLPHRAIKAA
jgi:hypothetical protein